MSNEMATRMGAKSGHFSSRGRPDDFQTRPQALEPLWSHLRPHWTIWEPACGKGNLVRAIEERGYDVIASDVRDGRDFLTWKPDHFDCIVTNPPFSMKDSFIERCYALDRPFALLVPLTVIDSRRRQKMFRHNGIEFIFVPRRLQFETPSGKNSGTWFMSCWITRGLGLPPVTFWDDSDARLVAQSERPESVG